VVTQADIDNNGNPDPDGFITNVATGDSDETDEQTSSTDTPLAGSATSSTLKTVESVLNADDSVDADGIVDTAGDKINYKVVYTNTGTKTLHNVTVTDSLTTLSCTPSVPAASLAPGDSITCTGTYVVTQADIDNNGNPDPDGFITNVATGDSDETDEQTSSTDTPLAQNAAMTVEKSSTTSSLSAPATVNYGYLVTNTGNVTLTGIGLVDDNDNNDMSCPATTLAVGANMTCSATHTFTQAELNANGSPTAGSGKLTNNVTASSNEAPDATDSLDIPINRPVTAQILPTATTCQNYLDGAQSLLYENYTVKSGLINSLAPGVFFYYNTITVNSAPYTFTLTQSNTSGALNWKPIPAVSVGQIVLYNADTCTKSRAQGTTTYDPNTGTISLTVNATGTYVIGIKYDPTALKGTPVSGPPYPSVVYTFIDLPGSTGPSITVRPKP